MRGALSAVQFNKDEIQISAEKADEGDIQWLMLLSWK
jgi:hypothetical protein